MVTEEGIAKGIRRVVALTGQEADEVKEFSNVGHFFGRKI